MAALDAQAVKAVGQGANYVTIEVGSTDACTPSVSTMTSPAAFRAGIQKALATLAASPAAPQTRDSHPSASGQAKLAAITWARTQWKS